MRDVGSLDHPWMPTKFEQVAHLRSERSASLAALHALPRLKLKSCHPSDQPLLICSHFGGPEPRESLSKLGVGMAEPGNPSVQTMHAGAKFRTAAANQPP